MAPSQTKHTVEDVDNLGPEFTDADCLLISEVQALLDVVARQREEATPGIGIGGEDSKVYQKTKAYVDTFSTWKGNDQMTTVRGHVTDEIFTKFESAQLGNLVPKDVEEARALIQTLNVEGGEREARLRDALESLGEMQKYAL